MTTLTKPVASSGNPLFRLSLYQRMMIYLLITFTTLIILLALTARILHETGTDPEDTRNVMVALMVVGIVLLILSVRVFSARWRSQSAAQKIFANLDAVLQTGDHVRAIAMADQAQREFPTWETAIQSATAYIMANRIDQGEAVVRAAIEQLSVGPDSLMSRNMMSGFYSLLAIVALARHDYAEAERMIERAQKFPHDNYAITNTIAEVYLYRGRTEDALAFIDKAVIEYSQSNMPTAGFNIALRAWVEGQRGNSAQADRLINQALKVPDPSHHGLLCSIYFVGGHMEHALEKELSACQFYRKAAELDPDGLYGHLARVTMDTIE